MNRRIFGRDHVFIEDECVEEGRDVFSSVWRKDVMCFRTMFSSRMSVWRKDVMCACCSASISPGEIAESTYSPTVQLPGRDPDILFKNNYLAEM